MKQLQLLDYGLTAEQTRIGPCLALQDPLSEQLRERRHARAAMDAVPTVSTVAERFPNVSQPAVDLVRGRHLTDQPFLTNRQGVLHHWNSVYNPGFYKYALGRLLKDQIIAACPTASLHTVDYDEGNSVNKRHVSKEAHQYFCRAWHNYLPMSYAMRVCQSLKWRLQG